VIKMQPMEIVKFLIDVSREMANEALKARRKWYGKVYGKELESKIDNASASTLRKYLEEKGFSFKVISEEGFESYKGSGDYLIVDPIDGTSNMCRGIPFTAISLAISKTDDINDVYIGVVRDINRGDVYWAIKGKGAFLNNKKLRVDNRKVDLGDAFISISVTKAKCGISKILNLLPYIRYPRYLGSASLETCFVAANILDAYIDIRGSLRTFDIAAAQLIVKESGGIVLIKQNNQSKVSLSKVYGISIIAAKNKYILTEILKKIEK